MASQHACDLGLTGLAVEDRDARAGEVAADARGLLRGLGAGIRDVGSGAFEADVVVLGEEFVGGFAPVGGEVAGTGLVIIVQRPRGGAAVGSWRGPAASPPPPLSRR